MKLDNKILKYMSVVLLFMAIAILINNPINRRSTNLTIIALVVLLVGSVFVLFWKIKIIRYTVITLLVAMSVFLALSGAEVDIKVLKSEYVEALRKYEGVDYLWGGESKAGIDCSGLVRKGLIDTYFKVGVTNISPQYIRRALYIWFFDSSAEALRDGYRDYTVTLIRDITLNTTDYSLISEGDIMVTEDGLHTMVYIGDNSWIQADPGEGKVIIEKAPSKGNNWYNVKSRIVRWKDLSGGEYGAQ